MPEKLLQMDKTELLLLEGGKGKKKKYGEPYGGHRQHLLEDELNQLLDAAKSSQGKHAYRNWLMLYMTYRHGLRREEVGLLRWVDADLGNGSILIHRSKGSKSNTHNLNGQEIRALKKIKREYPAAPYIFAGYGGKGISGKAVSKIMKAGAAEVGLPDELAHPHVLRHTRGYLMIEKGYPIRLIQEWLGHRDIRSTTHYTALSARQFREVID